MFRLSHLYEKSYLIGVHYVEKPLIFYDARYLETDFAQAIFVVGSPLHRGSNADAAVCYSPRS